MKVWRLHIHEGRHESEIVTIPYHEGDGIPLGRVPARYIGKWIWIAAVGPLDVPPPDWWPRQLSA